MIYTETQAKSAKPKFCLKKGDEYLASVRVVNKSGTASMSYCMTSEKDDALQLCTKVAALALLCAIESHLSTEFEITQFKS